MRDDEGRLRDALRARASSVPVGRADEPGLARRLAAARRRRQTRLAGAAALVAVAVVGGLLVGRSEDRGHDVVAGPSLSSTTTDVAPSTTTAEATTIGPLPTAPAPTAVPTTGPPASSAASGPAATVAPRPTSTTAPLAPVPDDAVWPPPGSATSFPTADRAAADFAHRFVGMGSPRLDPPQVAGGDATVAVHAFPTGGLTTTVTLRRVDRRGWVVLGCTAENISVDQPAPRAVVASPLPVRGRSLAFEAQVVVEVRQDGALAPVGRTTAMGGGTEMLPYETTVSFPPPSARRGALLVSEPRADVADQGPASATVVRVSF